MNRTRVRINAGDLLRAEDLDGMRIGLDHEMPMRAHPGVLPRRHMDVASAGEVDGKGAPVGTGKQLSDLLEHKFQGCGNSVNDPLCLWNI